MERDSAAVVSDQSSATTGQREFLLPLLMRWLTRSLRLPLKKEDQLQAG